MLMHTTTYDAIRPRSNDERRAEWALRYFAQVHHRTPQKPRLRVAASLPAVAPAVAGKDSK